MIGIDTNVLVRYLAQDDERQSAVASAVIEKLTPEAPGFVSQIVLVETVWVLTRAYRMGREAIANAIEALLRTNEIVVERAEVGYLALATYRNSRADFADALIVQGNLLAGCTETVTFDEIAARDAGMRKLRA